MTLSFGRLSITCIFLFLLVSFCVLRPVQAQTTATIDGVVTDIQGGVIQKATVIVTNTGTGISRTLTTDEGGRYQIGQLIPGMYTVTANSAGFKKTVLSGIKLEIAQTWSANVTLQVGDALTEVVNVTAEPLTTDTQTSSVGEVIDNAKVEALPL